jgi:hypothetical protein
VKNPGILVLAVGDVVTLALVTLAGFATHNELESAGLRIFSTFVPLCIAWYLVAPHLRVYDWVDMADLRQLWRPLWAMVLAAPLAGWFRGAWLDMPIQPIFVAVLGGVSALAIFVWSLLYWGIFSRGRQSHG